MAEAIDERYGFDIGSCDLSRYSVLRKCLEDALHSTAQQRLLQMLPSDQSTLYTVGNLQSELSEEFVPLHQYKVVIDELEREREAHKKTKLELTDVEDKLSFAIGEVEILRKQVQREKAQFQMTLVDGTTFVHVLCSC